MKRFFALILTLTVLLGVSVPAMAASKDALKVQYEGRGYVEVDFNCRVRYKNTSVTVKDPSGNALAVKITEKDDDDSPMMALRQKKSVLDVMKEDLSFAAKREAVKAVYLEINSPGGEVTTSDPSGSFFCPLTSNH